MLPDYSVIGRRIKKTRLEQKVKQEELADKIGISIAFMSRIETGKGKINLKRLIEIAQILNVSPGYFLTGSNTATKDYLKEDFKEILDKCTPQQQKLIYQISQLVSTTNFDKE